MRDTSRDSPRHFEPRSDDEEPEASTFPRHTCEKTFLTTGPNSHWLPTKANVAPRPSNPHFVTLYCPVDIVNQRFVKNPVARPFSSQIVAVTIHCLLLYKPDEPLGAYHVSALTPFQNVTQNQSPVVLLRRIGRPPKQPSVSNESPGNI
ncbi:hypothetical protein AVEN_187426-1 [Araneus ventricosus]|uniref:Uncharacterized protein n=1 Tax=Araneus ventricosus TaxID=182803 RepID=A0A4Y2MFC5_ARAVE|nr:hypothetical protein AVEN_53991-1 [Araneus ventricosus]GBN25174.1 hypothetical protein AVEN_187426-1 [Araneus ventricosus]